MRAPQAQPDNLTFQLAPMVDVIFILILFFMTSAGLVQVEKQLSLKLPGTVMQSGAVTMPDEQIVEIADNGQVIINGSPMDAPDNSDLPQLLALLHRFKQMSEANRVPAMVTIMPAPKARYQRIVDVMNACAACSISNVTFSTGEEQ
jgi:biopolymer transport protein ExbD